MRTSTCAMFFWCTWRVFDLLELHFVVFYLKSISICFFYNVWLHHCLYGTESHETGTEKTWKWSCRQGQDQWTGLVDRIRETGTVSVETGTGLWEIEKWSGETWALSGRQGQICNNHRYDQRRQEYCYGRQEQDQEKHDETDRDGIHWDRKGIRGGRNMIRDN